MSEFTCQVCKWKRPQENPEQCFMCGENLKNRQRQELKFYRDVTTVIEVKEGLVYLTWVPDEGVKLPEPFEATMLEHQAERLSRALQIAVDIANKKVVS